MGGKKRPPTPVQDPGADDGAEVDGSASESSQDDPKPTAAASTAAEAPPKKKKKLSMERKKLRKELDKERHRLSAEATTAKPQVAVAPPAPATPPPLAAPALHMNVFTDLASPEVLAREAAAEALMVELREVQRAYEENGRKREREVEGDGDGPAQMEAEKDDGLENCAPSLRYAVRRLIRGISSSREFARQGFALGLTVVVEAIHAIKVEAVMKLIVNLLEFSSSMKGPEAKDNLLGRLFGFGSLARSGRVSRQWVFDKSSSVVKDFVSEVIQLAGKKRYLSEPAVSVILDLAKKLPDEALLTEVLEAPGVQDWLRKANNVGDPDALFLALKLQERISMEREIFGKLLPYPFSPDKFFAQVHLLSIAPCFKESTFCLPRIHSLWPVVINMLIPETAPQDDATGRCSSSKKHKKNKRGSSSEDITKNIRSFCEVIIEGSLLLSSHDRKHLAFNVLLILLPRLPPSFIQVVLSSKVVHGLMDVLSNESSWLHNAGQHFLKELVSLVSDDNDRRVAAIISLQKYSSGRFDCVTKTKTVKELVAKFHNGQDCLFFVQNLMALFVDEGPITDEPSDQSQTTDENSEVGSMEDRDPFGQGNTDLLKNWVVNTIPRVLKNLRLTSKGNSLTDSEIVKSIEEKFRVQTEIMKFLAVQGLFSASLGTEVTSFELQEKFKWPKAAILSSLRNECIEQLQFLLEDAQKGEGSHVLNEVESNDLGSYLMRFINTVCNIPSVSLCRSLSNEDEKAFKKLLAMESKLFHEERRIGPGLDSNKMHAMRYLLIQLLLQVLLCPGEFSEATTELIICCKKSFPAIAHGDSSDEDESDENGLPEYMDVLVGTCLSLLPNISGPVCFAIEQVFRVFCDEITETGLLDMLRVVKKDLKPLRHQTDSGDDDDDDDDDFIGIEDAEETGIETAETGDSDDLAEESEGKLEDVDEVNKDHQVGLEEIDDDEANDAEVTKGKDDSDDSDGMDDDAMFRIDPYIARVFKERKISGSDSVQSQLIPFKLRVLTLLEIYLQRNPGKTQVLKVYSFLMQAFVKSHGTDGGEQLKQRIGGILQKRIFKAKDYPKGSDVELTSLESLLEKSLTLASRSRFKTVSSLAQHATFWILKIINSKSYSKQDLVSVVDIFRNILVDYFNNKKSRLKLGFVKEVIRRHPWMGQELFGFILQKFGGTKAEYRRIQTLELVDCIMKSWVVDVSSASKLLKKHLGALCELIQELLTRLPENKSRRQEVRRFCTRVLHTVSMLNLINPFLKALKPDVYSLCQSQLGAAFVPFIERNH